MTRKMSSTTLWPRGLLPDVSSCRPQLARAFSPLRLWNWEAFHLSRRASAKLRCCRWHRSRNFSGSWVFRPLSFRRACSLRDTWSRPEGMRRHTGVPNSDALPLRRTRRAKADPLHLIVLSLRIHPNKQQGKNCYWTANGDRSRLHEMRSSGLMTPRKRLR